MLRGSTEGNWRMSVSPVPITSRLAGPEPAYLRAPEVALFLSISRRQAYRLITNGTLPSIRLGRSVRVRRDALLDYLSRHEVTPDEPHDR